MGEEKTEELIRLRTDFLKSGVYLKSCTGFIPRNSLEKNEIYIRSFKFSLVIHQYSVWRFLWGGPLFAENAIVVKNLRQRNECFDYISEASLISAIRRITWFGAMPIFKAKTHKKSEGSSLVVPGALRRSEKSAPTTEGGGWELGCRRLCVRRSQNGSYVWRLAAKCNGFKNRKNNKIKTWKLKLREINWLTNFLSF